MATTISSGTNPYKLGSPPDFGTLYSGRALEFDGVSDYVSLDLLDIDLSEDWSISAWINTTDTSTAQYIFTNTKDSSNRIAIQIASDNLIFGTYNGSTYTGKSGSVSASVWNHMVATITNNTLALYINGVAQVGTSTPGLSSTATTRIGVKSDSTTSPFDGKITNVQLWDKAWTLADVQWAYTHPEKLITDNSAVTSGTTISNLKAWYPCTEGNPRSPQTTVYDGSPKELGSELITVADDRTFDSDTGFWAEGSGVTFGSGTCIFTSVDENVGIQNDSMLENGKVYKFTFDIATLSSGSLHIFKGGSEINNWGNETAGSKTVYFTSDCTSLRFRSDEAGTTCTLDNFSLKEVQMGNHGTTTFEGDEQITDTKNRDFSSASDWVEYSPDTTLGAFGDDASPANLEITGTTDTDSKEGAELAVARLTAPVAGRTYRIDADMWWEGGDAGTGSIFYFNYAGTQSAAFDLAATSAGTTYTKDIVAANATGNLQVYKIGNTNAQWNVDNVSVKEVGVATGWTTADAEPLIPQTALMGMSKPMVFNGIDEYVTCGSISEIAPTSNVAVSLWFQAPNISNYDCFVSRKVDANNLYKIWFHGNKLILEVYEGSSKYGRYIDWTPDSDWHHLVAIWDTSGPADANATLYLDGSSPSHTAIGGLGNGGCSTNFQIGLGDTDYFSGIINEVATFNTVLSLAQVQELFND